MLGLNPKGLVLTCVCIHRLYVHRMYFEVWLYITDADIRCFFLKKTSSLSAFVESIIFILADWNT